MYFTRSPANLFIIWLVLTVLLCPVLTQITTVYVDEKNSGSSPADATTYRSLADAIQQTGAPIDGVEILLVGDSVTIGSTIVIPPSSNYTIKPYELKEGQTYFPLNMNANGFFSVDGAVLTLQQLQIIELDSTKSEPGILMGPEAVLNLNSILFKDYTNSDYFYPFVYKEDADSPAEINIDNCVFSNVENIGFQFNATQFTIANTLFDNYRGTNVGVIFINSMLPDLDVTFRNVTVQNSIFPEVMEGQTYGLFSIFDTASVYVDGLVVKNVTVARTYAFFSTSFGDLVPVLPTISLSNIKVDGFFQSTKNVSVVGFGGLGFQLMVAANVIVSNMQVNNFRGLNVPLLQIQGQPKSAKGAYGNATISDLGIQNSLNPTVIVSMMEIITCERFEIYNNKYYGIGYTDYMFQLYESKAVMFKGLKGKNNTSYLLYYKQVYNITTQDWDLEDLKISQKLDPYQFMIHVERAIRKGTSRTDIIRPWDSNINWSVTTFQNITINGFNEEAGIDHNKEGNNTYLMRMNLEYGKVFIKDSHLSDIELGGILNSYIQYLSIDNLTYDANPAISFNDTAKHKMMQCLEIGELYITNSKFLNNKNVVLLTMYNIYRSSDKAEIKQTSLYFENNEVTGNIVPYEDGGDSYTSLHMVRSPKNPIKITFKNCQFKDNTVVSGIILNDESAKIDLDLLGNRFENNKALDSGVVLVADAMHNQFNVMRLIDNTFIDNSCEKHGGVFLLNSVKYEITSRNNVYINNRAKGSGGVGYFVQSNLAFSDTNSTYSGNLAENNGGTWYLSFKRQDEKFPLVTFTGATFEKSTALREGGAIFIATGDARIQGCKFSQNTANIRGGDIKLVTSSSLQVTQTQFIGSSSPFGCVLDAEAIVGEVLTFQNVQISNVHPKQLDSSLVALYAGSLVLTDSSVQDVSSSLFEIVGASLTMSGVSVSQVTCNSNVKLYCVILALDSFLAVQNLQVSDVISSQDIVVVQRSPNMTEINNIHMLNIRRQANTEQELFGIALRNASITSIHDSSFNQFTMSSIKASNSTIDIVNSQFSNARNSRILQDSQSQESDSNNNNPRFIVLETSSSQITGCSFIENSPDAQQNGGAIMIHGTGGRHNIQKCTFQGNNGVNGGAINVEGVIDSFNLEDCQFSGNQATGIGGSIYFNNDKSNKITPIVTRTKFNLNKAWAGAGIYLEYYPLLLQDSEFTNNTATTGAAVTSSCEKTQRATLYRNKFISNSAEVGAVLMAFEDLNFDDFGSEFVANQATSGGDISSKPSGTRLAVYEVVETFLYLEDIPTQYIKDHYQTKLIYDYCNTSIQNPIMMKSGRTPNLLFEFTVVDELNQTLSNIEKIEIILDQKLDSRATSATNGRSLSGTTDYKVAGSSILVFDSFLVRGNFDSSTTLTASAVAYDALLNKAYQIPSIEWQVVIGSCTVGEVYDPVTLICNPCPENSYSFANPFTIKTCQKCFESAECIGGNAIFPRPGYWRMSQLSDNFVRCAFDLGCLGGQSDEGRNISLTGFCASGYEGVGCGACSDGFVKSGSTNECLRCSDDIGMHIRYVAYFVFQIILTIFTIRSHMNSANQSFKERYGDMLQSSIIKVVIDFLHVLNLTVAFNIDWPRELSNFMDFTSEVTPSNKDVFSIDCIINSARETNKNIFFIKQLINIVQPIFFILVAFIVLVIYFKATRRRIFNNEDFKEKIILTTVIIVYILQPDILKGTFQVFNCKNYGPTYDTKYYLIEDTTIECWTYQHLTWILGLAIPSFILWLILPCAAILSLLGKKELTHSENFRRKYNFIFEKYKPNLFFWEVIVLMRKVVLIVFSVFLTFTYYQAYISFLALIIAFLLQRRYKPYIKTPINYAEQISLYCSAAIMYSGLFFVRTDRSTGIVPLLLVLDLIGGAIFFGYCIYVLKKVAKQKILAIKEKLDQIIDTDQFKWKQIRKIYRRIKQCFEPKNKPETVKTKEVSPSLKSDSAGKRSDEGQLAQNAKEVNENQEEHDSNAEARDLETMNELALTSYGKVDSTTKLRNVDTNVETARVKSGVIPIYKMSIPEAPEDKENKHPSISIDLDLEERIDDAEELDCKVNRYPTLAKSMVSSANALLQRNKNLQ